MTSSPIAPVLGHITAWVTVPRNSFGALDEAKIHQMAFAFNNQLIGLYPAESYPAPMDAEETVRTLREHETENGSVQKFSLEAPLLDMPIKLTPEQIVDRVRLNLELAGLEVGRVSFSEV